MHFSHNCPLRNSKTNDPKVLKLGMGNNLGISMGSRGHRLGLGLRQQQYDVGLNSMNVL